MFLWLYGLTYSLTLYFIAENEPLGIQLTPLLITSILSLLVTLRSLREKVNPSFHMASLATNVLILLLLWSNPDSMYVIFAGGLLCIAIVGRGCKREYILFYATEMASGGQLRYPCAFNCSVCAHVRKSERAHI